ncbi:MAG: hypothetical protein JWR07_1342 [Nevskia sp.]|nr:hypothetical protein [Nevskia sp.]
MAAPGSPGPDLFDQVANVTLATKAVSCTGLNRVGRKSTGEPYFGSSGGNRWDDPLGVYGVCYLGDSLVTAFAESVLHDREPIDGQFHLASSEIDDRFAIGFGSGTLHVVDLTGVLLKRLGFKNDICAGADYGEAQKLSRAIYQHPAGVAGIRYVSRQVNTQYAYAIFDRAASSFGPPIYTKLQEHADLSSVIGAFHARIHGRRAAP